MRTKIFLVLLIPVLLIHAPMFTGRVPFPSFFVFQYPPYAPDAPPHLESRVANIGDLVSSFYPYRAFAAREVREGRLPLWNPYMSSGVPFAANPQSALFYPPNAVYYVLPLPVAWTIGFLLRPLLGGGFTLLLMKRIGASTTGALVAAFLFVFSGFMTVWQGQAMSDGAIWLPFICYSVVRLHEDRSRRFVALAAVAFAMPVLAGHPETAAHLTLTGIALAAFLACFRPGDARRRDNLRYAALFCAAGSLAIGLAAVQILPTLEWLQNAYRGFDPLWPPAPAWSLLGVVSRDILRSENSFGLQIPEHAAYIGMLAFVAVPLAFLGSQRRYVAFFTILTAAALCVAYGFGPLFTLSQHVPLVSALKNHRLILVATFGMAVLAGLGVTALEELRRRQTLRAVLLMAIGFVTAALMILTVRRITELVVEPSRFPRISLLFLLLSCAVILLGLTGRLKAQQLRAAILIVVAIDVGTFAYGFIPFEKPENIYPRIPLFDRLPREAESPFRIAQTGDAYVANAEILYRLRATGGYEIPLKRIKQFLEGVSVADMDGVMLRTDATLSMPDRRADMLNTRFYLVVTRDKFYRDFLAASDRFRFLFEYGGIGVFENLRALPPAYLVPSAGIEVIPDETRQLQIVRDSRFDPERRVVLPALLAASGRTAEPAAVRSNVSWVDSASNEFRLRVEAIQPSVLVVSQIYYPGWKAWVDGDPAAIVNANFALTGILVPRGVHDVRFRFEPASFRFGLFITFISIAILTIGLRPFSAVGALEHRG